MSIALILGSGRGNIIELSEARQIAPGAPVICVNDAVKDCPTPIEAFVTLHPELVRKRFLRALTMPPERTFSQRPHLGYTPRLVREKWAGSSGLYGVQIALLQLGFSGAILCGIPMSAESGAIYAPGPWAPDHVERYRTSWRAAKPEIADRVRSMSGWTREEFGAPSIGWAQGMSRAA